MIFRQIRRRLHTVLRGLCGNRDHVDALPYVELSGLSVGKPVIVVDTIGDIAALLGLQNQKSPLDGVDSTRVNLDKIPLFHRNFPDELLPAPLVDHIGKLLPGFGVMADDKGSSLGTVQHIPAFRLSQRPVFMLSGIGVIRMHLDAQILSCVNDFDQKRKPVVIHVSE